MANAEIPTVTLCDLARTPAAYFDKTVRLSAVFSQHQEGQYLTDERCPFRHDDQIGVGYAEQDEAMRRTRAQMAAPEYGGQAEVTVVGVLRNVSARHFYWYGTLFEIAAFESAWPAVAVYDGELAAGRTYRAKAIRYTSGDVALEQRPRVPLHHAGRVEWTNIEKAPRKEAYPKGTAAEVVFRVVSRDVAAAGTGRWNTTFRCEFLRFE